jgi:uncharacterized protein with GYD domain
MAIYMAQAAYTTQTWATLAKHPQDRSAVLGELIEKLGGRLIGLYYCFGEYDTVAIFEAPDDITASAIVLAASSPGHVKTTKTTRLFTVQETMEMMRKAGTVTYEAPSKG